MDSVPDSTKTCALKNGAALLEEMKLLGELHGQSAGLRTINSELWHACAGPLVSLPQVGSFAYYFPQGHSEQVAVSTGRPANTHIPNYPNLPSQLLCQVHHVTLHADKDTDEIYAQMTLQPVKPEKEVFTVQDFGLKQIKHPTEFFCKTLTASDTSTHGGFSVPRRAAEKLFPPLDHTMQPPTQELVVRDLHDNSWTFRHIYRGQPRRHLLTTGWSLFVGAKRLRAGDSVLFIRDEKSQLLLGVRRANHRQTALSSSVLSADSMHMGVLAAAAHAAANRSPFTIFYNPRACPSEFVIPLAKYHKAILGMHVSAGMRFGMMFETEESGKRRYTGTVIGISDLDPTKWSNSRWRNLQVEWDEPGCGERPGRVSLWEIETPESPFICPAPISGLKRPFHSAVECDWETIARRSPAMIFQGEKGADHYPLAPNLGSELMKMLLQPPAISPSSHLIDASIVQQLRTSELLRNLYSTMPTPFLKESLPQQAEVGAYGLVQDKNLHIHLRQNLLPSQNIFPQNQTAQGCQDSAQLADSNLGSERVPEETLAEHKNQILQEKQEMKPDMGPITATVKLGDDSQKIMSVLLETGPVCQVDSADKSIEDKLTTQLYQDQCSSIQPVSLLETSRMNPMSYLNHQLPPCFDNGDWLLQYSSCQSLASVIKSPKSLPVTGSPPLSPSCNTNTESNVSSVVNLETTSPMENLQVPCVSSLAGSQNLLSFPELTCLKFQTGQDLSDESNNQSEVYSNLQLEVQSCLENFSSLKEIGFQNLSECLLENYSSSQDMQSQVTSAGLGDCQVFSFHELPDNSGGVSSSNVEVDQSTFMQQGSWQQVPPCLRTYTKVQKLGSVGRSIDVTRYQNYHELKSAIAAMFGLEGQLDDPRGSGWKLVYVDYENDVLLVGDDPWEEFVNCVRCIRILSPSEVQQMSLEGMELLNNGMTQGGQEFIQ